ncbi:cytochrome P450 [Streptomyces sp. NPDC047525]|uniref:cytochrome P450 n=1 Tax=Streptomyces sp. NPDC047525 TaxID=3155264 RepID=UPI00340C0CEA
MTTSASALAADLRLDEINLVDPDLYENGDPFALWRILRDQDPAHWHPESTFPGFWALTRYEDVKAVYRDASTFSSAQGILLRPLPDGPDPGSGRTLALTDSLRHRQIRSLVGSWFQKRSVRDLESSMRSAVRSVIAHAAQQDSCDFVTDIAARLPLYAICQLMDVPHSEREFLFTLARQAFTARDSRGRSIAHQEIVNYFISLMLERRQSPGEDLVSALLEAKIDGVPLSEEDILLNCDNLFVGGTENVRLAASGGMQAFFDHPDQWNRLRADPALLPSATEEVLRWTSSATHIMRTATRSVVLHGKTIQKGDRVTLWNPSANRDERVFNSPDFFDIGRRPNPHIALGTGEHHCIGALLARTELKILFSELANSVASIELAAPPTRLGSIVVNGLKHLPVKLTLEAPSRFAVSANSG